MPNMGRRHTGAHDTAASPAPDDDDAQGGDWIADYYRRQRRTSTLPVDVVVGDESPTLEFPRVVGAPGGLGLGVVGAGVVPCLAVGVELVGEYRGSGLAEVTFLARNCSGRVVHLSRLLWLVVSGVDGVRSVGEIAARVSAEFGRSVSAGNVEYLLAHKLVPLGLVGGGEGAAGGEGPDLAILTLRLRGTLVPEAGVQVVARLFGPLFWPPVVAVVLGLLAAADVWLVRSGVLLASWREVLGRPLLLLVVVGLSAASMVFHECGHAAACRYGGARPGRIGAGVYVMWPALFTNVTDSYRLGRAGRIRTDLGGVYFNAVFAVALAGAYRGTGCLPLLAAVLVVQLEAAEQLLPSLRLDGYFILTDLVGVPDLFRQIGPVLRSLVPGQPPDPRVGALRRPARVALTAWVLVIVPLLGGELALLVVGIPRLAAVFARSITGNADAIAAQFGRGEIAAGLVSVISVALLVFPAAGLCYVLWLTGRVYTRLVLRATVRRRLLRIPLAAAALAATAGLALYWGLLPLPTHHPPTATPATPATSGPAAASIAHPRSASASASATASAAPRSGRPVQAAVLLMPVSAQGFDPLASPGSDPDDENSGEAEYAIDGNPATAWQTQYYLGSPFFGGLKKGVGLILDMGRPVRVSSVTVTFGRARGADVAIEVGNSNTLSASTLAAFTTIATADGIGGTHTFTTASQAKGRYVLIWFTKLPPDGSGKYAAQVYDVVIRGTR